MFLLDFLICQFSTEFFSLFISFLNTFASSCLKIEKCYKILETEQFRKHEINPTITVEGKLQRMLRSIKNVLTERLYTTISQRLETRCILWKC